jgi:hypothetical protein
MTSDIFAIYGNFVLWGGREGGVQSSNGRRRRKYNTGYFRL